MSISYTRYLDTLTAPPDIHDQRRQPLMMGEVVLTVILAVVIGLADVALISAALADQLPVWMAVALHLAVIFVAFLVTMVRGRAGTDTRGANIAVMLAAVTGPFGAFGSIITALSHLFYQRESLSFSEWFRVIYPRPTPTPGESLYDNIVLEVDAQIQSYDVIPFTDVMRLGSASEKREAINQMTLQFHPRFAPAFRQALKDPVLSVRTLAANAIARIETHLATQERKLQRALERTEDEDVPELLLAAGQFYDDYAYSGLLDVERERRFYQQALKFYRQYLQFYGEDARVEAWIGRVLIRSGEREEAANWLKQLLDKSGADSRIVGRIVGWYAELLYDLGRFAELRQFTEQHDAAIQALAHEEPDSPLANTLPLWVASREEAA